MPRSLTFNRIATTQDTGNPVIKAELPDVESWLIFVPCEDCIRVQNVQSNYKGDMAAMVDAIVEQLEMTTIRFMNPLDELKSNGNRLIDKLHGFELDEEVFDHPYQEGTITVESYIGEWNSEKEGAV